jgi:O-acetyl-ADP-ribose deacetylase (regulator of RNase III)
MLIQAIRNSDYFQAGASLKNYENQSRKQNIINFLYVLSYFTVIIPLAVGVIVGLASLCGRVSMNNKFPTNDKIEKIASTFQNPSTTPSTNEVSVVKKPHIESVSTLIQTPESVKIRPYPGDLSKKDHLSFEWEDKEKMIRKIAFKEFPHIHFSIRKQDLFISGAEVIVNAANSDLGGGGGIDGKIHENGGDEYAAAHRKLKEKYSKGYPSGHAAMIDSGQLKAKYKIDHVIVVAGPCTATPSPEEESQLYSCYYNSLVLANDQNKAKIALPSISTGLFYFPLDRAANISLRAVNDFIANNSSIKIISIHFRPTEHTEFVKYMTAIDPAAYQ